MIPESEIDEAALNDTKSIDRIDGFKAGVAFVKSKFEEAFKDIIIENQGLKLYKDNEAKRFEGIAIEFAKYLFSSEITRNPSKEDEMVYTSPEFNLMKADLIKNGKELFNNFLKERINLKKLIKKPILITEDGVEIFKGDIYWRLIAVIKKDRTFTFLEKSDEKGAFPYRGGGGKFFSTKEAAEKYLDENRPMYSKKDMLSFGASMSSKLYPYQCEGCLEHWKRFKKEKGE